MKKFLIAFLLPLSAMGADTLTVPGALVVKQGASTGVTITNTASQVGLVVNGLSGQAANLATFGAGGTNGVSVNNLGNLSITTGSANAPSVFIAGSTNTGIYGSNTEIDFAFLGAKYAAIGINGQIRADYDAGALVIGSSSDVTFRRKGAAAWQLGSDAASPIAQALASCSGSGTDKSGASLTIEGGQSTGSGRGGDLIFRTSITTNGSSTANFYSTRAYQSAKFVDLTDATTNLLFKCSLAPSTYCGGSAIVTLFISNGTDFKVHTSNVSWSAVNKGGAITGQVVESTQLENHIETAGTAIADTYTLVQDGANNVFYISVTPTQGTVITPSVYRAKWVITALNSNDPATITPP